MSEQEKQQVKELESRQAVLDKIRTRCMLGLDEINGEDDDIADKLSELEMKIYQRLAEIEIEIEKIKEAR